MADESASVELIDQAFADFAHPQPAEKLLLESVIALQNSVVDLMLRQRKIDGNRADGILAQRVVLRAKYKLLGYDSDDTIRFTP